MNVSFDNTQIAFSSKSDGGLRQSYWLFRIIGNPAVVIVGKWLTYIAVTLHIPIKWLIKPTIFKQFCGGENVEESREKMNELAKQNIKSVLDYSAEGKDSEKDFDHCMEEILSIIKEASGNKNIGFAVFKPTGVARIALLERVSTLLKEEVRRQKAEGNTQSESVLSHLTLPEQKEFERVRQRFDLICKSAHDAGVPLFIDAEESWIQRAVDGLVNEMMALYNREKPVVYNTFQLYRKDRLEYLIECFVRARRENYFLGAKLVRGAYMEKERERAEKLGYASPIQRSKEITDSHYDSALRFCLEHLDRIAFCCASHNETSSMLVLEQMKEKNIPVNHPHIYFSQLLGMSDHISYNLAEAGYNVSKYVPYGPVREVLPYLIRRAQENTSVKGQTGRELSLIIKELQRRRGK